LVGGLVVPHPAICCQIWTDAPAIRESMVARWGQPQADLQGQRDGHRIAKNERPQPRNLGWGLVLPSPAGYCDERDVISDKSMLRCEDQRIGMPIFRADLLQMDHNGSFGSIQNGPLPPKWASPGTGLSQTSQGGQTETPAEREGTAGVPVTGPFRRGSVTEVPPQELTTTHIQKR
jgi:hypothetical protein